MLVRQSDSYPGSLPRPLVREVLAKLDARERRWLLRSILHELLHDRRILGLGFFGGAMFILGINLWILGDRAIPVPAEAALGLSGIGMVLLGIALRGWTKFARVEIVQYLLRLDRCGCCAQKRAVNMSGIFQQSRPDGSPGWTCSECGATWWAGRADRSGQVYRDVA